MNAGSEVTKREEIIKKAIENNLNNNVTKKLDDLTVTITMLRDELKSRVGLICDLKDENKKLSAETNKLKNFLDDMESAKYRDNLTYTGIRIPHADVVASQKPAETADRQTAPSSTVRLNQVVDICNKILDVPVKVEDISATYMLSKGSSTTLPVIGVKFVRRTIHNNI